MGNNYTIRVMYFNFNNYTVITCDHKRDYDAAISVTNCPDSFDVQLQRQIRQQKSDFTNIVKFLKINN